MAAVRRPPRNQATALFPSLSFFFFALVCLLALCPPVVKAEEAHPEYGTVIGIGGYIT
jgi:heat shock protein 5